MALRFHFFNAVRRLAARIARLAERWAQRFETSRSLAPGARASGITGSLGAIDGDEAYELVPLLNDSGEIQAGAFAYGIGESQQMIELLRKEKIYGSGSIGSQSVSSAVGDFAAQLTPALATAVQAGQLMRIVGPPSVVQGLANGSMTLMRSGGHTLGGVVASGSSQLVGQARFASAAGIVAPLLVYQAVHAIVGTQQLNEINRRLANIERTLSRIVERQNARDLGEVIAAASTLQDILNEHAHSGHFNAQMQDRISHCERDLRAHLERLKILKANFHDKIQQARNKAKRRDKALELAVLIKEEGEQFGQDVRLLVALCGAVIQLEQGLMLIALEHHPESLAYREKQLKEQMKRCRETLTDMVDLSEMNWWQQNLFDRSAAHVLKQAADLPLGELAAEARKEKLGAAGGGMLVWRDPDQGIQVRAIAAAAPESDTQNPPVREEDWPEAKHLALAPSSSLQVGEIYRLPITDLDVEVPIRILKQRGHGEWIGMRMDTPDIEHVEVLVDND
jgi:hypothetical protein